VRPGQIWADNDPRAAGRTLRVESVYYSHSKDKHVALCTILTNRDDTQTHIDHPWVSWYKPRDMRGQQTEIAVVRFRRPTSTGYRLIQDVERGCYRCQLGDPHTVHETATDTYGADQTAGGLG
jgi:hypothetical protein